MIIKYYAVLPTKDITQEMINESLNNNDTIRMSLDCTCAILKFYEQYPNTVGGYQKYNHSEMLQYLEDNKLEWEATEV